MKRQMTHIIVPLNIWEHDDLSLTERCILIELSTYPQETLGCTFRPGMLATALHISKSDAQKNISSLIKKGAIEVNIDEDGRKWYSLNLSKERYIVDESVKDAPAEKTTATIDYDYIAEKWAEYCSMLTPITRFTTLRKTKVRTLLAKNNATVEDLVRCFQLIGTSQFLTGSNGNWRADFDWIIRDNKGQFQKTLEGGYHSSPMERLDYERIVGGQKNNQPDNSDFYK